MGITNFLLDALNSVLDALNLIWTALKSDPIKSIAASASTISAIIGWKNLTKDITKVNVVVHRARSGPLILQNPQKEFLLFQIYNQGISPVFINEIGIKIRQKLWDKPKFINLIDFPYSSYDIKGYEDAIGSLDCVSVPGSISARSTGIFLLNYSSMKEASDNYQKCGISPSDIDFVGSRRVITVSQEFQKLEIPNQNFLQITPYILTGSGELFVGKKSTIKLGDLRKAVLE